jgi:hypothetical protein
MESSSSSPAAQAYLLKQRIDNIHLSTPPIGSNPCATLDLLRENDREPDYSTSVYGRLATKLREVGEDCADVFKMGELEIGDDFVQIIDLPGKLVFNDAYAYANPAKFGDVKAQATVEDSNVRKGRDIPADRFTVPQCKIEELRSFWEDAFGGTVRVEPYKINLYAEGDFFAPHKDTPHGTIIGTILVSLTRYRAYFRIDGRRWREEYDNVCAFYTDVPHHVNRIESGDQRMTVAFKVHSVATDSNKTEQSTAIANVLHQFYSDNKPEPIAILLRHMYGFSQIEAGAVRGADVTLCRAIEDVAKKQDMEFKILPVARRYSADYYESDMEDASVSELFYPVESSILEGRCDGTEYPWYEKGKLLPVFRLNTDTHGEKWAGSTQKGADYTGNEAMPYEESSVYIQYMIVIY